MASGPGVGRDAGTGRGTWLEEASKAVIDGALAGTGAETLGNVEEVVFDVLVDSPSRALDTGDRFELFEEL